MRWIAPLLLVLSLVLAPLPAPAQVIPPPNQIALVCAYNSSPPTPTSGQFFLVQCDSSGKLITAGASGGGITVGGAVTGGASSNIFYHTTANTIGELLMESSVGQTSGASTIISAVGIPNVQSSAYHNTVVGYASGENITTAHQITGMGYQALSGCTTCVLSTAFGNGAGDGVVASIDVTAVGHHTASNSLGNTEIGNDVTAIGAFALQGSSGKQNVGVGTLVMGVGILTTDNNTGIGYLTLEHLLSGALNTCGGEGSCENSLSSSQFSCWGAQSCEDATASTDLACVGFNCGQHWTGNENSGIGSYACRDALSNQQICIGYFTQVPDNTTGHDGQLVIGNFIYGTGLTGIGATISSGFIGIGNKAPSVQLDVAGAIRGDPVAFASLPTCTSGIEGAVQGVTDSTTTLWGANIAGSGSSHVLAYCSGSNWTVAGAQTVTYTGSAGLVVLSQGPTLTPLANSAALTVSGYSLTGANAQSLLDLSGTWNTSGTPTAIKLNITNTASNASSLLMDLQVNSTSVFKINTTGVATMTGGIIALGGVQTPNYFQGVTTSNKLYMDAANDVIDLFRSTDTTFDIAFGGAAVPASSLVRVRGISGVLQSIAGSGSGFAFLQGKLQTDTNYTGTIIAATGYLTLYDATGTAYKVPACTGC